MGRALLEAQDELREGAFNDMINHDLPFGMRGATARKNAATASLGGGEWSHARIRTAFDALTKR
jgi:hypothetical protein